MKKESARSAAAPAGEGTPLLFVEDDAIVSMSAVELLESAGYRVHAAARGEEALAILDSHREIKILVTDIGLPGMNGQQLATEARRRQPGLKVLFVTGYDRTGTIGRKALEPDTLHIIKPYAPEELFATLRRLSNGAASAAPVN